MGERKKIVIVHWQNIPSIYGKRIKWIIITKNKLSNIIVDQMRNTVPQFQIIVKER